MTEPPEESNRDIDLDQGNYNEKICGNYLGNFGDVNVVQNFNNKQQKKVEIRDRTQQELLNRIFNRKSST